MSTTIELNDSQIEALTKTKECITLLDYGTEVPADIMLNFLEKKSEATQNECALALGYKDDAKVLLKTLRDMTTPPSPVDTPPKSDAVVPPPGDNSGLVEKATGLLKPKESEAPLRNQGFTDLYVVSRLLQLGVGPTVKNEAVPQLGKGFFGTPISIGKKALHYGENSAVTVQKMFQSGNTAIFNWIYEKAGVDQKHTDLMLRQLDTMRDSLSESGMKKYVDTRKALTDAAGILTQIETEAAKTKPDSKVLEELLKNYTKATDQYHRFRLFTRIPAGTPTAMTPEFHAMKTDITNQVTTLSTGASKVEVDLKKGERRQKSFEDSLKKQDVTIATQDTVIKKAEKTFAEKEKALNTKKDSIRPTEQAHLERMKNELATLNTELAPHTNRNIKTALPTGIRDYTVILNEIKNKNTEIFNQNQLLVSIENGTHASLTAEKLAFDTAKTNLETATNRKIQLEDGKRASEVKLTKIREENTKLGTKHTEAQAKLAKLPDLTEMNRLLSVVENSPYMEEKIKAEKLLQKMRADIDPSSRLYTALSGHDTATRRAAIESEKTHRTQESLFVQGTELPTWMSEKQKEKVLKAREKIGEIYSQVDALHKEAKDIALALDKDPKIATAEQFSKEVNTKVGVINDKITRLSPLIDDVIRDVSIAFPGISRVKMLDELKIPALPNAGGSTWIKKWNGAIETHAVNTKAGKGVFGALMLVGAGHATYDGFTKEGIAGSSKELTDIGMGFVPGYDLMVAIKGETLAGVPGVEGKKLTTEERWIRAGFGVLGLVPVLGTGVKALATSAKVINMAGKVADGTKISNTVVRTTDYAVDGARLAGHAATVGVIGSAVYNMAAPVFTSNKFKLALVDVNPVETRK